MHQLKLIVTFFFVMSFCSAQNIQLLTSKEKISLRGLSVVNDNIIWASGSSGQVARSTDGGKNFEWITVKGYEKRDFRDIEAFDANTALIMAVDTPAIILKTKDGGKTWKEVFYDDTPGMFLDAMDFDDKGNGVVVGDPVDSIFFISVTNDFGEKWQKTLQLYYAYEGEAMFAASGTNIKLEHKSERAYTMVTGGTISRCISFLRSFEGYATNTILSIIQGKQTTGANSIAIDSDKNYVIVGGDFANDKDTTQNCILSYTAGRTWIKPQTPPHGYRSCVAYITKDKLICCGTSGIDISNDGGLNWQLISNESFHVCAKAKKGTAVFLAGKDGRIAKLIE